MISPNFRSVSLHSGSEQDNREDDTMAKHTEAGDGRLFRNNVRDTASTAGKHVADREPKLDTSKDAPVDYTGKHRAS